MAGSEQSGLAPLRHSPKTNALDGIGGDGAGLRTRMGWDGRLTDGRS